jgi:hypothetical protein
VAQADTEGGCIGAFWTGTPQDPDVELSGFMPTGAQVTSDGVMDLFY